MDKFFDFGEFLGLGIGTINLTLLVPIVLVVGTVVGVFMFGFNTVENPRFPKGNDPHSSNNGGSRSKRKPRSTEPAGGKSPKSVAHRDLEEQQQQQQLQQQQLKNAKKGTSSPKTNAAAPAKMTSTIGAVAKKQTAAKQNSASPTATKDAPKSKAAAKAQAKAANLKAPKLSPADNVDGEWQTVITKKQKKQLDPLIQAVSGVAAAITAKKGKQAAAASPPKIKEAKLKIPDVAPESMESTFSALTLPEADIIEAATVVADPPAANAVPAATAPAVTAPAVTAPAATAPAVTAPAATAPAATAPAATAAVDPEEVVEAVPPTTSETSLVFDELGDKPRTDIRQLPKMTNAAWTENKPQRKNRRRALRE